MTRASLEERYGQALVPVLEDFLRFADEARELIVAYGADAFFHDRRSQLAAEAILSKLGEAVARLPERFILDHPQVAWRAIKGMRNIVAHAYDQVDYRIIWTALAERLPQDAAAVRDVLDR